jgi:uncharacterized protein YpmB
MRTEDRLNLIQVLTIFIYLVILGIIGSISYVYKLINPYSSVKEEKYEKHGYRKT